MAWTPISGAPTQYSKSDNTLASGYYLKFYQDGTTTAFSMATDSTGGTTLDKCQLDSSGYPTTDGTTRFIPHVNQDYKIVLYKTSADADANTTGSAEWVIDKIKPFISSSEGPKIFETVAAMVASTTLSIGDYVQFLGYYTAYDGGGNSGIVVAAGTGTDDGGTYIDLDTHQFKASFPGGIYTVKQWGAKGDGITGDRAEINSANSNGPITINAGTYSIESALTISSDVTFRNGAILKPASGITVTITGSITASMTQQIFDLSAGGSIQFEVGATDKASIMWFGAISDDESGTVPADNVTAISKCIQACNPLTGGDLEGDAAGSFRNITTYIPPGMFSIDNADIDLPSYVQIAGEGDSSILACKNGTNSYAVFLCTTAGANSMRLRDFAIYGDQANQTGTINGIEFNVASGAKPVYNNFHNLVIKEMSGNALKLGGSVNIENSGFHNCMFRDSKGHNILVTRANNCDFNELRIRSAKTGSSGCVVDGTANNSLTFNDCRMEGNNTHGLFISNTGGRMTINGGSYSSNLDKGVYIDRSDSTIFDGGCLVEQNTGEGITVNDSEYLQVGKGVISRSNLRGLGLYSNQFADIDIKAITNQQHGIVVSSSNDNNIKGTCIGNSTSADDTYNGVIIQSNSDNNNLEVFVRHGGGATQQKYGVEINDAPSTSNRVTNCDLLNSGRTASILDSGTTTVTTAGNRT